MLKLVGSILLLMLALAVSGQELPDEIRGYKVHEADILVTNSTEAVGGRKPEAVVRMNDPVIKDKSLKGLTFEIDGGIETLGHSGTIDFLSFKDFKVNGLAVSIEDYVAEIEFKKKQTVQFPRPIEVFVGTIQTIRGAFGEIRDSKPEWEVTGTVFVFGKFKKWGMKFRRVVPVKVQLKIKNPITKELILSRDRTSISLCDLRLPVCD